MPLAVAHKKMCRPDQISHNQPGDGPDMSMTRGASHPIGFPSPLAVAEPSAHRLLGGSKLRSACSKSQTTIRRSSFN